MSPVPCCIQTRKVKSMTQRNSSKPRQEGTGETGNRGSMFLVRILGIGILLALVFVGAIVIFRLVSGPAPTPTPVPTLRPTYTPTTTTVVDTPVLTMSPSETPVATASATEEPAEPTAVPETVPITTDVSTVGTPSATTVPATATAQPSSPTPRPPQPAPGMASPDYGVQAFLWWRPEVAHRDLGLIRDGGFTWVKQWFAWRDIEGKGKGQYDWTTADRVVDQVEEFGLKLVVRVDHEPEWAGPPPANINHFADFLSALATRYRGRIQAYQVWNEPNLAREWGNKPPNAQEYTQMLKTAYQTIKKADPSAIVISAGMAPTTELSQRAVPDTQFIQAMYNAGAKPYFDMLGAHGAGYKAPPEMDPGQVATDANYYNVGDPPC
jgi:hypothetical protein